MSDLLVVEDLCVDFGRHRRPALRHVSFAVAEGERLGLIGESGSGKSVTALAILGLLPDNAHVSGSIRLRGTELVGLPERRLAAIRGDVATMIFQEPMTALDPTMRVGRQVAEVVRLHGGREQGSTRERVVDMLAAVGLPEPATLADAYPHQLSGGQRQRVVLAMALMNRPALVLADEPTTALDVTVQARVLRVLGSALDDTGAACLFISHDLAVVAQVCTRALVMLHGEIVESGDIATVLRAPQHPYTRGLVATADLAAVAPGQRLPTLSDFYRETA